MELKIRKKEIIIMTDFTQESLLEQISGTVENYEEQPMTLDDLFNHAFNEDYYIIGTYKAEQALEEYGTFEAIHEVKDYEEENFGEVNTDLSDPEEVANMLAYILGEQLIEEIADEWDLDMFDDELSAEQMKKLGNNDIQFC